MARVRMRLLIEWDIDENEIPEGADEYLEMMEWFAQSTFPSATAMQRYVERNPPEE